MRKKAYGLFVFLLLMLGAACWSMVHISGGTEYVAAAGQQSIYKLDVAKARGTIYDCNLKPLVGGKKELVAAVAPTIEAIGKLEKATDGKYRGKLAAALENGKPFQMLLEEGVVSDSIDLFNIPERYAEGQLAPHVIGYLDSLGAGVSGVELAMNDVLENHSGEVSVYYQVDALGHVIAGAEREVVNTLQSTKGGVVLTLDEKIQRLAQDAAAELGEGAVVVTEVPNCEIRALVSMPDFSPEDVGAASKAEDSPLLNRAFSAYAPGSVFKLTTAAAELDGDAYHYEFTCTGSINAGGMLFHCINGKAHGKVDLRTALEKSCNCYFINAARVLGGQDVVSMAYNLGFGMEQEFGRGLSTDSGTLPDAEGLENTRALANFAFGQGDLTVTPVQMCGMINAIASGGSYSTPKLISGTVDPDLEFSSHQPVSDKTVEVMKYSTAQTLQDYMKGAVKEGTAQPGMPENCVAGVKTGTAQTGIYQGDDELLHFWYCGFISDGNGPRYCVTVLRESTPDDKGVTGKIFKELSEGIAKLYFNEEGTAE